MKYKPVFEELWNLHKNSEVYNYVAGLKYQKTSS